MIQIPAPLAGRPLYLNFKGGRIYISVHDAFHLERQREFKRQIRSAHPDRNHHNWASNRTRKLLKARERWEEQEARWYGHFGLDPPKRKPQRNPSVGNGRSAADLLPVSPRLERSGLGNAHPSPTILGSEDDNPPGLIRTPAEQRFKRSATPACHSPPETWPAVNRQQDADGQRGHALPAHEKTEMSVTLVGAIESSEVDKLLGSIELPDIKQRIASRLDSRFGRGE